MHYLLTAEEYRALTPRAERDEAAEAARRLGAWALQNTGDGDGAGCRRATGEPCDGCPLDDLIAIGRTPLRVRLCYQPNYPGPRPITGRVSDYL